MLFAHTRDAVVARASSAYPLCRAPLYALSHRLPRRAAPHLYYTSHLLKRGARRYRVKRENSNQW